MVDPFMPTLCRITPLSFGECPKPLLSVSTYASTKGSSREDNRSINIHVGQKRGAKGIGEHRAREGSYPSFDPSGCHRSPPLVPSEADRSIASPPPPPIPR